MATITISLPDAIRQWVEQEAESRGYASASDYVLSLIRREQARAEKLNAIQAAVTEGLESGEGECTMDELKEKARERVQGAGPRDK